MAMIFRILALCVPIAALAVCASSATPAPLDRSGWRLVFAEEFDAPPSFYDPVTAPQGRWKTNFFFGVQDINHPIGWGSRTLEPNKELQFYAPPDFPTQPFEWKDGVLSIVARPNPSRQDRRTNGLPYLSGIITTEKSFAASTGYFEARLALPPGRGLWPAFWLLPVPKMENGNPMEPGKQELDVMEAIGEPGRIYHTIFRDDKGTKAKEGAPFDTGADLTKFHTYGVKVTEDEVTWYFDDKEVRRTRNVDFHRPAYLLLNLAVGGNWPGTPGPEVKFPARMQVDWVRVYALK